MKVPGGQEPTRIYNGLDVGGESRVASRMTQRWPTSQEEELYSGGGWEFLNALYVKCLSDFKCTGEQAVLWVFGGHRRILGLVELG